jgi:hypothetical protein
MNDIAKALWSSVLEHDTLLPVTAKERELISARIRDMSERMFIWQASEGQIAMPTIGEVCNLAADLARVNVRAALGDLAAGREPRASLPLIGLSDEEQS